ncbi:hypothetical protein F2Q70_00030346 [Brassica cretica]|uniref:Uncharacterized protein n=1 Tax=Brassica cretica TaxID=69181 RepID=A0A8S9FFM8_BRACR|nr:hypothetical protein F2Q70_00030346 [Brassica cretica]
MLQGISLSPAFGKHSGLTTDVRSQNCCSCLDLICDRGVRTKGSRKFVPGKRHPPIPCFVHAQQYQKQQGQTPAILRRSCSLGTNDPQRPTFHIARRSSFHVDRFSYPTVDRHPTFIVDRSTSQDENGDLYDHNGHLRNATGQKLDAQGNVIPDTDAIGDAQPVEEAA